MPSFTYTICLFGIIEKSNISLKRFVSSSINSFLAFDIDNPSSQISLPYSIELTDEIGHDIYLSNFFGIITNFKVFDIYNDNISELLQMYPTHQHLMINDTARRINGLNGVLMK